MIWPAQRVPLKQDPSLEEWWRQRSKNVSTPPIITVDDFLSYRSRCFILDVRPTEEFDNCHFQSSRLMRSRSFPVSGSHQRGHNQVEVEHLMQ